MHLGAIPEQCRSHPPIYVSDNMSDNVLDIFSGRRRRADDTALGKRIDREFEVFQLLGRGLTTREIGQRLRLGPKTVETHRPPRSREAPAQQRAGAAQIRRLLGGDPGIDSSGSQHLEEIFSAFHRIARRPDSR